MATYRQPNQADLLTLAKALASFNVEYVVIGGAAMALHGFARVTKDIDLLLPVNAVNNGRLLRALASMLESAEALVNLRPEWMDQGFSTALEGEIYSDLLYVAAAHNFEALRQHIQAVTFNGIPVVTLDVDGMLLTKQTTRESDVPDRLKLGRLKSAKQELALRSTRLSAISAFGIAAGPWRWKVEAVICTCCATVSMRNGSAKWLWTMAIWRSLGACAPVSRRYTISRSTRGSAGGRGRGVQPAQQAQGGIQQVGRDRADSQAGQ